jgi:DNA-binding GntR family transcriptional regulator
MSDKALSQKAYEHILGRILAKKQLPGDIVNRRAIADELGMSVSPVQEAIGRLAMEGFVEVLPRRVTRVRIIRPEDFRAQVVVRTALECQAARMYCGEPVRSNEERLLELAREVDASRRGEHINWPAEIRFHRALVELVDSEGFLAEYDRVMRLGHFLLVSTFSERSPFPIDRSRSWHGQMIGALQTEDPDEAEAVVRSHIEAGRGDYLRVPFGRPSAGAEAVAGAAEGRWP